MIILEEWKISRNLLISSQELFFAWPENKNDQVTSHILENSEIVWQILPFICVFKHQMKTGLIQSQVGHLKDLTTCWLQS